MGKAPSRSNGKARSHLPMITVWEQHYNNGHLGMAKKQGRAQQWSHTTITGEPNPPSLLFVWVKPRDLASRWSWGVQRAIEANQHTPDQISAMCGVTLGPNQSHVDIVYMCCGTKRGKNFELPLQHGSDVTSSWSGGLLYCEIFLKPLWYPDD